MSAASLPDRRGRIRVWRAPKPDPLTVALAGLEPSERLAYSRAARLVAGGSGVDGDLAGELLALIRRVILAQAKDSERTS